MTAKGTGNFRELAKRTTGSRTRTSILWPAEERIIIWLVQRIPRWYSSDMLTFTGFIGNIIVFLAFIFAVYFRKEYLWLGVPGFAINWFGDSLDGRIAYYRNKARKWYGYSLDVSVDWLGVVLIGLGCLIYLERPWAYLGFLFLSLYGWALIKSVIRLNVLGKHVIDAGKMGPTELRILISIVMVLEVYVEGALAYFVLAGCLILLLVNLADFRELLKETDRLDKEKGGGE